MNRSEKPKRRLALLQFYEKHDRHTAKVLTEKQVSCTKGCTACCRQLIAMTTVEAELIVDRHTSVVRAAVPKLRKHMALLVERGVSPEAEGKGKHKNADLWWETGESCALLVDGLCSVYESRPFACRNYFVLSDPADCVSDTVVEVAALFAVDPMTGFEALAGTQPGGEVAVGYLPDVLLSVLQARRKP